MTLPLTTAQLLSLLFLIVPGFVFQAVRIRLVGRSATDIDLGGRVLRAVVASTVFVLIYTVVVGAPVPLGISDYSATFEAPRKTALLGLLGGFVAPAACAVISVSTSIWSPLSKWRADVAAWGWVSALRPDVGPRFDSRPTAWDVAFQRAEAGWFVRIKMADGSWYAGYWGPESWASTYPEQPSVFVETEYQVDEDGVIGDPVEKSEGSVIQCADAVVVELLGAADDDSVPETEALNAGWREKEPRA